MKLFIQGNVINAVEVEFKDKDGGIKKTKKVQFLEKTEKGTMELIDVKLDENEKLETINPGALRLMIDHNSVMNQSADFKYSTVGKFITVLMGYNTERQSLAEEVITKYWTKLDKPSLLGDLLHHAPFEIFKKYFSFII